MPRQSGLLRRKDRYYLNVRVPTELRKLYGKEFVRESLGTSEFREAVREVRFRLGQVEAEFAEKRRQLERNGSRVKAKPPIAAITDREAHRLVYRWFIQLEKDSEEWYANEGSKLDDDDKDEVTDNLRLDETCLCGGSREYMPDDGSSYLDSFLKSEGLECEKDSAPYHKLREVFRRARLENVHRNMARVGLQPISPRDSLFNDVFAHTAESPARAVTTLGEMLDRFAKTIVDLNRSESTRRTYEIPCRLLRENLGENTPLNEITRENIEALLDLLRRAPSNATKRYPGRTLKQAIAEADKREDSKRLSPKSQANYYNNIVAIFSFAVEKRLMAENPARDRWLREGFTKEHKGGEKPQFSLEELNKMFRAPLYVGCQDDGNGFAKPGPSRLRRGRFWLPVLSLFHGFRCNEAAQLYTEDVKEEDGIPFFEIREEREDGSKCDKRLKTKQSKRRVPIHPEVLKMGFMEFFQQRQRDKLEERLFPDLSIGASGYFSDPFSKWFRRFVKTTLGAGCRATFHSFRHTFRDALTEAGVPIPDVEAIGGWELMQRSAERGYGKGPSLRRLRDQMKLAKYPGLDLSHLQGN